MPHLFQDRAVPCRSCIMCASPQDSGILSALSQDELNDRLYALDAQFRRDMASLTERYDAARTAVENALAAKPSPY